MIGEPYSQEISGDQEPANFGDFYMELAEIVDRNSKPGFDGEEIRADLQHQLQEVRDIVAAHNEGAVLYGPDEVARVREAMAIVEEARLYEIRGVNMAHAWPATIEALMQQERVVDIEIRNPSKSDLISMQSVINTHPKRSRLIIVIDQEYPHTEGRSQRDIEQHILADVKTLIDGAQEGREVSIVFTENMNNILLAQINEFVVNQNESLYIDDDGAVWYRPTEIDNPFTRIDVSADKVTVNPGIMVLDADGTPTIEAREAASFINAVNADTVHLLFSRSADRDKRDKIWELARGMSMRPIDHTMFHEVFYDEQDVSHAAGVMADSIMSLRQSEDALAGQESGKEFFDFAFDWDVVEYVSRNYGEKILPEDKAIIDFVLDRYRAQREAGELPLKSLERVADVGAGPNLYTLMMITPYLSDEASVVMSDYTPANRRFLEWFAAGEPLDTPEGQEFGALKGAFEKFGEYMAERDPAYRGVYERLRTLLANAGSAIEFVNLYAPVEGGDELDAVTSNADRQKLDSATSAFVTESMANSYSEFILLTYNVIKQLKVGGRFVLMHMAESEGYNAGNNNHFPASKVDLEMVREVYNKIVGPGNFVITLAEDPEEKAREGYEGMIVVTGEVSGELPDFKDVLGLDLQARH